MCFPKKKSYFTKGDSEKPYIIRLVEYLSIGELLLLEKKFKKPTVSKRPSVTNETHSSDDFMPF